MDKISGTNLLHEFNKKVAAELMTRFDGCTKDYVYDLKTERSREMAKEMVNQNSFWGAWQEGMSEPSIFNNHSEAKEEVAELARNNPGIKAYLLSFQQVGSAVSTDMILKGKMAEDVDEDE